MATYNGSNGNNTYSGTNNDDEIYGNGGDDSLNGAGGNDIIYGGSGDDTIVGGVGYDTVLEGESGNDLYIFSKNDLTDTIFNNDNSNATTDTVKFTDVASTEVVITRGLDKANTDGLYVSYGKKDVIDLFDFFNGDAVDRFVFSDGVVWTAQDVRLKVLQGTSGDDYEQGYDGQQNTLFGLAGADQLVGANLNDTLHGGTGEDDLSGLAGDDVLYGDEAHDYLTGGDGNDYEDGGSDNDFVGGDKGNDTLIGGLGKDTMDGGLGADLYLVQRGDGQDTISNSGNDQAIDTLRYNNVSLIDVTAINQPGDNLTINTGSDQIFIDGYFANATSRVYRVEFTDGDFLDNFVVGTTNPDNLTGTSGNDALVGLASADTLSAGTGDDLYLIDNLGDKLIENTNAGIDTVLSSVNYSLADNLENLALLTGASTGTGNALNNEITGNSANNILTGLAGNDTFTGGLGNDSLIGGLGDDVYLITDTTDTITENTNEGTDLVISSISYSLGQNLEQLQLAGSDVLTGTGNSLNNTLTGNSGNNTLDGGAGVDTLVGGDGNDTYRIDSSTDQINETSNGGSDTAISTASYSLANNVENLTLSGNQAIDGDGNNQNNLINGNSAANHINGGAGIDTLIGGLGDDIYTVDNADDVVTELTGEGNDTVTTSVTYALAANIESLNLTGNAAINAKGNAGNNQLTGNNAANKLDGGNGADTLQGGLGDDNYIVDNAGDNVIEQNNAGNDTVTSSISYSLGNNVENLILVGTQGLSGTGNAANNAIQGNDANNTIDGGLGADTMTGAKGNDSYVVDNIADVVIEAAGGGSDTVNSSVSYTLSANVENLLLTGTAALNATGNQASNKLTGNSAANQLNGGAGVDTMTGGDGNDSYTVDNSNDVIVETATGGTDTVNSSVTYSLSANVEQLALTGSADSNATGNSSANIITGNNGNNVLNGVTGADTLSGGNGNDSYVVDNTGDSVVESNNEGTDSVSSTISYSLAANLENLTLLGTQTLNGFGNGLNNALKGNNAANLLNGGAGNDTLKGSDGADTLIGAGGKDTVVLTESTAVTDTVQIQAGDSTTSAYDNVVDFALTNGINTTGVDQLDLVSVAIAADIATANGSDFGLIKSHSISNGIISFDDDNTFSSALTLSASDVTNAIEYLQSAIKNNATVAFTAQGNTYVFQDNGATDTLVQLTGVTALGLDTSATLTDSIWLV